MKASYILDERSEVRSDWKLEIHADMVLSGQGADPLVIRTRQPRVVKLAERAIVEGMSLIHPRVALRTLVVQKISEDCVFLDSGIALRGAGVARAMAGAESIVAVVATLGKELEQEIEGMRDRDLLYQLALDGFGTAAIGELVALVCRQLQTEASGTKRNTTSPLYPGTAGWELAAGQTQIFSLVDATAASVLLNASRMMTPRKSVSFLIGIGRRVRAGQAGCRECEAVARCRHKSNSH